MKCKILEKASEMFLNLGFKSVTMDDISNALGMSKKTIYSQYGTKNKLVEATTFYVFKKLCDGIDVICAKKQNSITELFEIKKFVLSNLNNENSSPQYQLQKFFPETYSKMKKQHFEVMQSCIKENLTRGIEESLYRANLNVDFVTRVYFTGLNGIKDEDTFPLKLYDKKNLMTQFLEYHVRSIATKKGIETLEQILKNQKLL